MARTEWPLTSVSTANTYPGDANLKVLHQTFSYTGYWLSTILPARE